MPDDTPKPKPRLTLLNGTLTRRFATEEAGGWPSVEGTVRPATATECRVYLATQQEHRMRGAAGAAEWVRYQAGFYAGLIRSWDVFDGVQAAPVTPETVARLPDPVFAQLENICLGYAAGDLLGNSPASS